jgi:hypothetical protein
MYLRGDEVTNHERQGEHEHLHTITCHLGIFLEMSWKWASYSVDTAIMEVSATTIAKRSANLFQTVS